MRRRTFLSASAVTGLQLAARRVADAQSSPRPRSPGRFRLAGWAASAPLMESGISWGVPWPRGAMRKDQSFTLTGGDGKGASAAGLADGLLARRLAEMERLRDRGRRRRRGTVSRRAGAASGRVGAAVTVRQSAAAIDIDTGKLQCRLPRQGAALIDSMTMEGRVVARAGTAGLYARRPHRSGRGAPAALRQHDQKSHVEQTGPVRAVVKIEGTHKAEKGNREWLPFTVRLYFYGGQAAVRMVHTIVFDGDQEKDFIRGLGVVFRGADARADSQPARAFFRGRRGALVRAAGAVDWRARPGHARRGALPARRSGPAASRWRDVCPSACRPARA